MKTSIHFWSYLTQFSLEWDMFQTEVVEKLKTYFLCSANFFRNNAVYEIMWKNTVQPDSPHMTVQQKHIACWIPKATNTNSEYVIVIAFPLQQQLHKCASISCYTYTGHLIQTHSQGSCLKWLFLPHHVFLSTCPSVCMKHSNSHQTVFVKSYIWDIYWNMSAHSSTCWK